MGLLCSTYKKCIWPVLFCSHEWNCILVNIREVTSHNVFKIHLKDWFLCLCPVSFAPVHLYKIMFLCILLTLQMCNV